MKRDKIVFVPYVRSTVSSNQSSNILMDVLREKYEVVRWEDVSTDISKIKRVKAIVLNWVESNLTKEMKFKLMLYKIIGVSIIWVFHNRIPHDNKDKQNVKNMRWLSYISNYIMCYSKDSYKFVPVRLCRYKCRYVPHGHYMDKYKRYVEDEVSNKFVFGLIGQIRPFKNIELIIQAFKEIDIENTELFIAGDVKSKNRKYAEELKKACESENNICIENRFIPDHEMDRYLNRIDVMVLPYSKISSMNSGVMMLALSFGKPVIISDISMAVDMKNQEFVYMYHYDREADHLENLKITMKIVAEKGKKENQEAGKKAVEYLKIHNGKDKIMEGFETMGL